MNAPSPQDRWDLASFPFLITDRIRYNDTDRQGHVNNAVYATFMELARVEVLHGGDLGLQENGASFVLARIGIDYRAEVNWPGEVQIGTRVVAIGRSSVTFENAIYQHGKLCASGQAVVVLMDLSTRRSRPMRDDTRARLQTLLAPADNIATPVAPATAN